MHEKLSHLSEEKVKELIERYYNKEKVKDLIKEFDIKISNTQIINLFPLKVTEGICPYCNVNLVEKYQSRDYCWSRNTPSCPKCNHIASSSCNCKNCKSLKQEIYEKEKEEKRVIIREIFETKEKVNIDSFSYYEKVYVGAFLREGISEDFNYIKPLSNFLNPYAPTKDLTNAIVDLLFKRNIIVVSPSSDPSFFTDFNLEEKKCNFYTYNVEWLLNVYKQGITKVPLIESLVTPKDIFAPEESLVMWRRIALHESIEYLQYSVNNVLGVEYAIGEKTISVMKDLLNDFSVGQIYSIIYRCTNNALRFQVENRVSRQHAANTIIGNAQSFAERAKINKWNITNFKRYKECPESALSKFFFEKVLKIGNDGFNQKPRLINTKSCDYKDDLKRLLENDYELDEKDSFKIINSLSFEEIENGIKYIEMYKEDSVILKSEYAKHVFSDMYGLKF